MNRHWLLKEHSSASRLGGGTDKLRRDGLITSQNLVAELAFRGREQVVA